MNVLVTVVLMAAALGGAVFFAWPVVGARLLLTPIRKKTPDSVPEGFRRLELTAADGVVLDAWFRPAAGPHRPIGVVLHGIDDEKGFGVRVANLDADRRRNWILFDLRAHGRSGGDACTYGCLERDDVSLAIGAALERGGSFAAPRAALYGMSLGGAVGLLAAARDPRITAVWSQSAFSDLRTTVGEYFLRMAGFRSDFLVGLALRRVEATSALRVDEASPRAAAASLTIPLVIAHGTEDAFVPPHHARRIAEAARHAPRELYWIEGAGHLDVWARGGDEYRERVRAFFEAAP